MTGTLRTTPTVVRAQTIKRCQYSTELSIRLMIRQIFQHSVTLLTPENRVSGGECRRYFRKREPMVNPMGNVRGKKVKPGERFREVRAHVVAIVNEVTLCISITHRERTLPAPLTELDIEKSGVLEIKIAPAEPGNSRLR